MPRLFRPLACLVWAACLATAVPAQESTAPKPREGHSIHGEAFNEGPRQSGYLMLGQGAIHFPVTTTSGQVQAFVDQGVGQLHGYFYFEAERSFRQAATLDPGCPMLYWGMAMANTNNESRARGFLKTAKEKTNDRKLTRREQLYLDALSARYDGKDDKAKRSGWLLGLETISQEFPDDLDARAWLAMVTWENARRDGIGSRQSVSFLLDSIVERHPLHPGAHHYKIHLWDGVKQEMAEPSAMKYALSQPGIAHAWHMPGHTYTGLRRYSDAAYMQEGSARVDHAYMARDRVMPFLIHNYAHNNQWLAESLTRTARPRKAAEVARNLVEQPRDPKRNAKDNGGSAQRSGRQRWQEALVTFELWDDLVAAIDSGALDYSDIPFERLQREYALGLARAGKGDADGLSRQIDAIKALTSVEAKPDDQALASNRKENLVGVDPATGKEDEKKPDEAKPDEAKPEEKEEGKEEDPQKRDRKRPRIPGLDSALAELEGQFHLLRGETDPALKRFEKAGSMRKDALARAFLKAGKLDEAVKKAKEAVDNAGGEVAPLATYIEILTASGKADDARKAYTDLLPLLREAEPGLPVLSRLEPIVAGWKSADGWEAPALAPRTDDAFRQRIDLSTLGPLNWGPVPAEPFQVVDHAGHSHSLEDYRGKNLVLIFFLGGQCAHCMQQLLLFTENLDGLRAEGTEILAIGTDSAEQTKLLAESPDAKIRMPLVGDPGLELFRRYRAHDDFEGKPLHGTFLIDAQGKVRFADIAHEPFLEVEFVRQEAARVRKLVQTQAGQPTAAVSPSPEAASGE